MRYALARPRREDRIRTLAAAAGIALLASACKGPPARLVAGTSDTVVVNNERPVQLGMHVFDAAGHTLADTGVRYLRTSGDAIPVSAMGVAKCTQTGEAVLRASLGAVATDVYLICRPVRGLRTAGLDLVVGDSAQPLPFEAIGVDGKPVTLLAGTAKVMDTTVARLDHMRVSARSAGQTMVGLRVGDWFQWIGVKVYQPVQTLDGLRAEQEMVALRVRLASGDMRRWRLPRGRYLLGILPDSSGVHLALLDAPCTRLAWSRNIMCDVEGDATVIVYAPWQSQPAPALSGTLAVQRLGDLDPDEARPRPARSLHGQQ